MSTPANIAHEIVETGRLLYQRGLIAGSAGNISVRIDNDRILVTPSGLSKGGLETDDLVLVDAEGRQLEGHHTATSELPMHLRVYRDRPDIRACVHSHAPYSTSFAVAGMELPDDVMPEVVLFVGSIGLTEYAPPGTDEVGQSLTPFLESGNAFLLRNHGLLTVGESLLQAFYRHETVEQYARIVHLAKQLGKVDSIPPDDRQRLERIRQRMNNDRAGGTA